MTALSDCFMPRRPAPIPRSPAPWCVPPVKEAPPIVPVAVLERLAMRVETIEHDGHVQLRETLLQGDHAAHVDVYESWGATMRQAFRDAVNASRDEIRARVETRPETAQAYRKVKGAYKPCKATQTRVYFSRG